MLEVVDDPAMGTCTTRARLLGSVAWSLLVVPDAPAAQALSLSDRAIALLDDEACLADEAVSEQRVYAGVALNGALAALAAYRWKRLTSSAVQLHQEVINDSL